MPNSRIFSSPIINVWPSMALAGPLIRWLSARAGAPERAEMKIKKEKQKNKFLKKQGWRFMAVSGFCCARVLRLAILTAGKKSHHGEAFLKKYSVKLNYFIDM